MAKNVLRNPGRALDLIAKTTTAAVSKNSKQAPSTLPDFIKFKNTGKDFTLVKFLNYAI